METLDINASNNINILQNFNLGIEVSIKTRNDKLRLLL